MVNDESIQDDGWLESFVDQALKIHSVISIEASRQIDRTFEDLNNLKQRKAKLEQVLALIEQLDLVLASPSEIKQLYLKGQFELFQVLEELEISCPVFSAIKAIKIEE